MMCLSLDLSRGSRAVGAAITAASPLLQPTVTLPELAARPCASSRLASIDPGPNRLVPATKGRANYRSTHACLPRESSAVRGRAEQTRSRRAGGGGDSQPRRSQARGAGEPFGHDLGEHCAAAFRRAYAPMLDYDLVA